MTIERASERRTADAAASIYRDAAARAAAGGRPQTAAALERRAELATAAAEGTSRPTATAKQRKTGVSKPKKAARRNRALSFAERENMRRKFESRQYGYTSRREVVSVTSPTFDYDAANPVWPPRVVAPPMSWSAPGGNAAIPRLP